jgi:hypothetical protein
VEHPCSLHFAFIGHLWFIQYNEGDFLFTTGLQIVEVIL